MVLKDAPIYKHISAQGQTGRYTYIYIHTSIYIYNIYIYIYIYISVLRIAIFDF